MQRKQVRQLLSRLREQQVVLRPEGDTLMLEGTVDPALLMQAHRHRRALLALVKGS